jgi:transposase-like protein
MAKSEQRLRAMNLRSAGTSIKDIARQLKISPGTVSVWCRELRLSQQQQDQLRAKQVAAGHRGRVRGAQVNHERYLATRQCEERAASAQIGTVSERDQLLLGIGLYWGEGTKTRTSTTAVINTSPEVLRFMCRWFVLLGVEPIDFRPYISISSNHRSREQEVIGYWVRELGIPQQQFGSVVYLPIQHKKVYENSNLYYGSVALRIRRSARLKYRILGLIKACMPLPG